MADLQRPKVNALATAETVAKGATGTLNRLMTGVQAAKEARWGPVAGPKREGATAETACSETAETAAMRKRAAGPLVGQVLEAWEETADVKTVATAGTGDKGVEGPTTAIGLRRREPVPVTVATVDSMAEMEGAPWQSVATGRHLAREETGAGGIQAAMSAPEGMTERLREEATTPCRAKAVRANSGATVRTVQWMIEVETDTADPREIQDPIQEMTARHRMEKEDTHPRYTLCLTAVLVIIVPSTALGVVSHGTLTEVPTYLVQTSCGSETVTLSAEGTVRIEGPLILQSPECGPPTRAWDAPTLVLTAARIVLTTSGTLVAPEGGPGIDVSRWHQDTARARGGPGGNGGDVVLSAKSILLQGRIHLGNGGPGGDAVAVSLNDDARAIGGDGGRSGRLVINAAHVVGEPTILEGRGGDGGTARAIGGDAHQGNGSRDRRTEGENGTDYSDPEAGNATAWALNGSAGRLHGEHGGNATAIGGRGGQGAIRGGRGGNASAIAGDGGPGQTVEAAGRDAGDGGDGGEARARGGRGGFGRSGGHGGTAVAVGGRGGYGGTALGAGAEEDLVEGGSGGVGGLAGASGGNGGDGDLRGGDGGGATSFSGGGGDGGDAHGASGKGGDGGDSGPLSLFPGLGGYGPRDNGTSGNVTGIAGDGGNGGNGTARAGSGGSPWGPDRFPRDPRYTLIEGKRGQEGELLESPPSPDENPINLGTGAVLGGFLLAVLLLSRARPGRGT